MATEEETPTLHEQPSRFQPQQDLSAEWSLKGCATIPFEGVERPSVGRMALLGKLGRGGMGVVYYGVNPRLGTEVAIKILPRELQERSEDLVDRFTREAQLAARLRSKHLVSVLEVDRDDRCGVHYLVMEYVRGRSAADWMRELRTSGQAGAPEAAALDVCIAATRGLEAAHLEGIVHRDVKPGNILIPSDAAGRLLPNAAKLADLGLARAEDTAQSLTGSEMAMGSPGYMAPEQAKDVKRAKKPADVFGVGATLYSLLTGNAPFKADTGMQAILATLEGLYTPLAELRPDVSAGTTTLIERCLDPDPVKRFPDASALLSALEVCRAALGKGDEQASEVGSLLAGLVQREERGKRVISDPDLVPATRTSPSASARPRVDHEAETVATGQAARRGAARPSRRWMAFTAGGLVLVVGAGIAWRSVSGHEPLDAGETARVDVPPRASQPAPRGEVPHEASEAAVTPAPAVTPAAAPASTPTPTPTPDPPIPTPTPTSSSKAELTPAGELQPAGPAARADAAAPQAVSAQPGEARADAAPTDPGAAVTPPSFGLIEPADDAPVRDAKLSGVVVGEHTRALLVRATCGALSATQAVVADRFEVALDLPEGTQPIALTLIDVEGREVGDAVTRTLVVDRTPPRIDARLIAGASGVVRLALSWSEDCEVSVAGTKLPREPRSFERDIDTTPSGLAPVEVVAIDAAGNSLPATTPVRVGSIQEAGVANRYVMFRVPPEQIAHVAIDDELFALRGSMPIGSLLVVKHTPPMGGSSGMNITCAAGPGSEINLFKKDDTVWAARPRP